ncbi:MAG: VWA domain-containing protein [Planctomycetota bacterium]
MRWFDPVNPFGPLVPSWLILPSLLAFFAAIALAIILLYFLKLKRRPLEVPSTYLWHRSIEDLHVNTIWQRLRSNLLLFLQLLLVFIAMLAVLRPGWRSEKRIGQRSIFVVDNSASMQATDESPSRLEEAKRQVHELIEQMDRGDVAMLLSFSDSARVPQMFTDSPRRLRRALDAIQPTERTTSLSEALEVASGRANPGRSSEDAGDVQVAEPLPATLYLFSDGKFPDVSDFRLGNLDPVYTPIGSEDAANVGIEAFSVRRHVSDPALLQAFARVGNFGPQDVSVPVELRLEGRVVDADEVSIPAGQTRSVAFDLAVVEAAVLELRVNTGDALACDDVAWAVVNPPRRSKVLVVTSGNEFLEFAFSTEPVRELSDVSFEFPEFLDQEPYQQQAALGAYDLVIYDRCRPKTLPQANTLFIGAVPPAGEGRGVRGEGRGATDEEKRKPTDGGPWGAGPKVAGPVIVDTDSTHPLMQWIDMSNVELADATPLEMPQGGTSLIDVQWFDASSQRNRSDVVPAFAVAPRDKFQDAVMGFVFIDQRTGEAGATETVFGTNWPIRSSFPVFVLNLLYYLAGGQAAMEGAVVRPGDTVRLESPVPGRPIEVRTPSGKTIRVGEAGPGRSSFSGTSELGVYEVRSAGQPPRHFAVNLFAPSESDIRPSPTLKIGRGTPIQAETSDWETTRRELWKWLLLIALAVLLVEWYIYHRRVYL